MITDLETEFLGEVEVLSAAGIRRTLDAGLDPIAPIEGRPPIVWMTEMYFRSDSFPNCVRLLLERGATFRDPAITAVLLDDGERVRAEVTANPALLTHRTTLTSSFTPLLGATLLHVAAEFGVFRAARALIECGADVNATADRDAHGSGGRTPIFHTVNSNANRSAPLMEMLLDAGASPDAIVPVLTWGRGFEWETTFFDVTPISYAQFGLMPQMHRKEVDIYANTNAYYRRRVALRLH
jgi:ankyrin repeat protein